MSCPPLQIDTSNIYLDTIYFIPICQDMQQRASRDRFSCIKILCNEDGGAAAVCLRVAGALTTSLSWVLRGGGPWRLSGDILWYCDNPRLILVITLLTLLCDIVRLWHTSGDETPEKLIKMLSRASSTIILLLAFCHWSAALDFDLAIKNDMFERINPGSV